MFNTIEHLFSRSYYVKFDSINSIDHQFTHLRLYYIFQLTDDESNLILNNVEEVNMTNNSTEEVEIFNNTGVIEGKPLQNTIEIDEGMYA